MTKETNQKELLWGDCKHCYCVFITVRRSRRYCSKACKQQAYRERKKREVTVVVIEVEKKQSLSTKLLTLLKKFVDIPF